MASKKSEPTVLVSAHDLPVSFKVTRAFSGHLENLTVPETDLFVMTHMRHTSFGKGTRALNSFTDGAVKDAIDASEFKGKAGEHIVFAVDNSPIKNILLIGIGSPDDVHRTTVCAMYRLIVDEAARLGARKVTIPFFPGLLIDFNYRGLLAVLRCRLGERHASGALGSLEEVEILCTSQARRHIVEGLKVEKQLCPFCRDPKFS